VDIYGSRKIPEKTVRQALGVAEGDMVPDSAAVTAIQRRLEAIDGVRKVEISRICCHEGKVILYVGIDEIGAQVQHFRPAPFGTPRLADEVVNAGKEFLEALMEAVRRGDGLEDNSQGYSLLHNPAGRAVQERYIAFAAKYWDQLRDVLHNSSDAS